MNLLPTPIRTVARLGVAACTAGLLLTGCGGGDTKPVVTPTPSATSPTPVINTHFGPNRVPWAEITALGPNQNIPVGDFIADILEHQSTISWATQTTTDTITTAYTSNTETLCNPDTMNNPSNTDDSHNGVPMNSCMELVQTVKGGGEQPVLTARYSTVFMTRYDNASTATPTPMATASATKTKSSTSAAKKSVKQVHPKEPSVPLPTPSDTTSSGMASPTTATSALSPTASPTESSSGSLSSSGITSPSASGTTPNGSLDSTKVWRSSGNNDDGSYAWSPVTSGMELTDYVNPLAGHKFVSVHTGDAKSPKDFFVLTDDKGVAWNLQTDSEGTPTTLAEMGGDHMTVSYRDVGAAAFLRVLPNS